MTDKNLLRRYAIIASKLFPQKWQYQGSCVYCNGLMVAETFGPYEDSEIDSDKIAKYIALTEPKTIIEMLDKLEMLSEENEKLKNENLALPHLLEYNKELEEKLKMSSFL